MFIDRLRIAFASDGW